MIVDIHTHAFPKKIADKARQSLETDFKVTLAADPTVDSLLERMDANGVDVSVICAVATRPDKVRSINDWVFAIRSKRLRVFAALHPGYEGWEDELERIAGNADGIKFQPEFQGFYVDDERMFPLYERISGLGLPVLFHCGEELSGTMLVRSSPERVSRVHERFPRLRIIAGHFGGFRMWDEVRRHLLGKDIYLDTAVFFDYAPIAEVSALLLGHRHDRIVFGTDFPLMDQGNDIRFLRGLDIPSRLKEAIFSENAVNLLRL